MGPWTGEARLLRVTLEWLKGTFLLELCNSVEDRAV